MTTPDSAAKGQPLEQILLAAHVITPEILQDARARARQNHERLGDVLVAMGAGPVYQVAHGYLRAGSQTQP